MARITTLVRPTEPTQDEHAGVRGPAKHAAPAGGRAATPERAAVPRPTAATPPAVGTPAGPRVRGSLLATLSVVVGAAAALLVLTGLLTSPGVALGILAAILSVGGLSASRSPTVAGKVDALLGLTLAVGAVAVGVLALSGRLPWLSPDTDQVARLRDVLDSHLPLRFRS